MDGETVLNAAAAARMIRIVPPVRPSTVREVTTGVLFATPRSRPAAARTSCSPKETAFLFDT